MYKVVGAVSGSSHPIGALHKCHSYAYNFTVSAKCPSESRPIHIGHQRYCASIVLGCSYEFV